MQHKYNIPEFLQGNIHLANTTRPGATAGHRNPRTLNIKGPMMGHRFCSNNHIRKRKLQGHWTLSQLRQPLELTCSEKRKVKRKK